MVFLARSLRAGNPHFLNAEDLTPSWEGIPNNTDVIRKPVSMSRTSASSHWCANCDLTVHMEEVMRRILCTIALAALVGVTTASAQERTGAGRIELGMFPGGGVFFNSSSNDAEPNFGNYAVGAGLTFNMNRWIGFEGEVGSAVGVKQGFTFNGTQYARQASPSMFAYTGNVVVHPIGNDRAFVPYAATGVGGLRLRKTDEVAALGVTTPTNFLTGNVGGGVKWFAGNHWGARAEYRLIAVDRNLNAPEFFGRSEVRYAHRIYGGVLLTY